MSVTGSLLFDEVCRRGSIHEADVAKLRGFYYDDGLITAREAEALLEIDRACGVKDPSWAPFFIEAIVDHVTAHAEPCGYITVANADWLIERLTHDGVIETRTELEILIRAIDAARWSPESLVRFALNTVKDAVLAGKAAVRGGADLTAGVVTDSDVELLRRVLFAFGGDGAVAVTRAEAEILFEINDATAEADNAPAWSELFVKSLLGVVMAASGYRVPSREEALRREDWLASRGELSPPKLLSGMAQGGVAGLRDQYAKGALAGFFALFSPETSEQKELARLEAQRRRIVTNEEITDDEASWLIAQINRDGALTPNEAYLLATLKTECPRLDKTLQPLLDRIVDPV